MNSLLNSINSIEKRFSNFSENISGKNLKNTSTQKFLSNRMLKFGQINVLGKTNAWISNNKDAEILTTTQRDNFLANQAEFYWQNMRTKRENLPIGLLLLFYGIALFVVLHNIKALFELLIIAVCVAAFAYIVFIFLQQ